MNSVKYEALEETKIDDSIVKYGKYWLYDTFVKENDNGIVNDCLGILPNPNTDTNKLYLYKSQIRCGSQNSESLAK